MPGRAAANASTPRTCRSSAYGAVGRRSTSRVSSSKRPRSTSVSASCARGGRTQRSRGGFGSVLARTALTGLRIPRIETAPALLAELAARDLLAQDLRRLERRADLAREVL